MNATHALLMWLKTSLPVHAYHTQSAQLAFHMHVASDTISTLISPSQVVATYANGSTQQIGLRNETASQVEAIFKRLRDQTGRDLKHLRRW